MKLTKLIQSLKADPEFMAGVTSWRELPGRQARYADFPEWIDPRIRQAFSNRGIERLYSHQRQALDLARAGRDYVVVTPTASGKTLCYNLPVLCEILKDDASRALYLFPTKALSSDQVAELYEVIDQMDVDVKAYTYDGDTPAVARRAIRQAGHVVVTNPDMLHSGILPHHTKWVKLFENLKYVVIDEIHAYRGVFGSNLANVIRRLRRICGFYGSNPQFICASATIKNPAELASAVVGRDVQLIDDNGAPMGTRHVILYNPPVINRQLGIRKGAIPETRRWATAFLDAGVQSIVFARSRLVVEVLTRHLKDRVRGPLGGANQVRSYRGGYLPNLRREVERDLRAGKIMTVVSTNALELGIDIGRLDACILCGYPGTIASTWQQAGRAGRRQSDSILLMVANSSPLDQYIVNNPEYFFSQSPENALINPDNLYILINHVKCAAYELPFEEGELFGGLESTGELLSYLEEEHILRHVADRWHWMADEFPQAGIKLRSATDQNFLIIDITNPKSHKVIGEMDRFTVPMLLHKYAIYLHEGDQYQVEDLDFDDKKAYIRKVEVDYYTDANTNTSLRVLDILKQSSEEDGEGKAQAERLPRTFGEVLVSTMVPLFKKIKLDTQENLGWGPVTLPELEMHTTACWWVLPEALTSGMDKERLQDGMSGVAYLVGQLAPLHLMCSPRDISVVYHVKDPFTQLPTLYVYDTTAGGIGLSDKVYQLNMVLFHQALEQLLACPCPHGCPSCVGASGSSQTKSAAIEALGRILGAPNREG